MIYHIKDTFDFIYYINNNLDKLLIDNFYISHLLIIIVKKSLYISLFNNKLKQILIENYHKVYTLFFSILNIYHNF